MTIQMICGSRNHDGQTAKAANAFLEGAGMAKSKVERVFLPDLSLERCRQCGNEGYGVCLEGKCLIDDDFALVFEKVKSADAILFATPVYFGEPSDSMLAFLSRLCRICFGSGKIDELKEKPAVAICVAGDLGFGATECSSRMDKFLRICDFNVVDIYPIRRQNLIAKLPSLRLAGEWVATSKDLMKQTK